LLRRPDLLIQRPTLRATPMITAMVGEVFFRAITTLIEPAAKLRCATPKHAANRSVVSTTKSILMPLYVTMPMRSKQL